MAAAAPGELDPSFSNDGKVTTGFPLQPTYDRADAVAVLPDGRILAAGYAATNRGSSAVIRYLPDGSLDPSFGEGGIAFPPGDVRAIAVQDDGKIVVAGESRCCTRAFSLSRLNPNGDLDEAFGEGGSVATEVGQWSDAGAVSIQENGRIVVAGRGKPEGRQTNFALARYRPDGRLDRSFSGNGKLLTGFGGQDRAHGLALAPDGSIVAAGETAPARGDIRVALARYRPNGRRDRSFAGDGRLTTRLGGKHQSRAFDVEVQPNAKIVVGGQSGEQIDRSRFALARYRPSGRPDRGFSGDGMVLTRFGRSSGVFGLARLADGRILASGYSGGGQGRRFAVARYQVDGALDVTFSGDGKATTAVGGGSAWSRALALEADGGVVAAGLAATGSPDGPDFAVVRYRPDGTLDPELSDDGVTTSDMGRPAAGVAAIAVQADGRIVAAGTNSGSEGPDIALARYLPNGELDPAFAGDGTTLVDFGLNSVYATGMAIQPDGRIVVSGGSGGDFLLGRLDADGAPDPTFSGDGVVKTDMGGNSDGSDAVAIGPDGTIVVVGAYADERCDAVDCYYDSSEALARYTPAGELDASFAGDGTLVEDAGCVAEHGLAIEPGGSIVTGAARCMTRYDHDGTLAETFELPQSPFAYIHDVALTPDGSFLTAGSGGNTFTLTRHESDLSLDPAFSEDGIAVTAFPNGPARAEALALQDDGLPVAAGIFDGPGGGNWDFAAARYRADGSLDPVFGGDGRVTVDFGEDERSTGLAIQPDGAIVLAGSSDGRFALARLSAE